MSANLVSLAALAQEGLINPKEAGKLKPVVARYAVAVTPDMAKLIDRSQPMDDPIGRQFLPAPDELVTRADESNDPIGDGTHSPIKGLVHRYPDRVLLKPTHICPVYCRFCFRREVVGPGGEGAMSQRDLAEAFAYIAARPEIFEVILTGGDPLILSSRRLAAIADAIAAIDHVKVLRVHTRVPIVEPRRVTASLVEALRRPAFATWIGVHANHPREFTPAAGAALARLSQAGFGMVSQTVLLAGINDDPAVLADLFRGFLALGVKPYYLHHLDRAPGTARFRVPIARGQEIVRALRGQLTGLAQPLYVVDIPGGHGKSPIGPSYLQKDAAGAITIEDFRGARHIVPE